MCGRPMVARPWTCSWTSSQHRPVSGAEPVDHATGPALAGGPGLGQHPHQGGVLGVVEVGQQVHGHSTEQTADLDTPGRTSVPDRSGRPASGQPELVSWSVRATTSSPACAAEAITSAGDCVRRTPWSACAGRCAPHEPTLRGGPSPCARASVVRGRPLRRGRGPPGRPTAAGRQRAARDVQLVGGVAQVDELEVVEQRDARRRGPQQRPQPHAARLPTRTARPPSAGTDHSGVEAPPACNRAAGRPVTRSSPGSRSPRPARCAPNPLPGCSATRSTSATGEQPAGPWCGPETATTTACASCFSSRTHRVPVTSQPSGRGHGSHTGTSACRAIQSRCSASAGCGGCSGTTSPCTAQV